MEILRFKYVLNTSSLSAKKFSLQSLEILQIAFKALGSEFGLMAWGQAYKSHLEKLLKLQKRALRFIYFSERNQHAIPFFIDAGDLPLKFLYYELLANLMFEIRHKNVPGKILSVCPSVCMYALNQSLLQSLTKKKWFWNKSWTF